MELTPLGEAMDRMRAAFSRLETALERRSGQDGRRTDAEQELYLMQDDRARLAVELDGALADNKALAAANEAAGKAVARAAHTIETLLIRHEGQSG